MDEIKIKLKFASKPVPISADYRPMYKIALIVMVLAICSRGKTASLLKLHFFSWALKSDVNRQKVIQLLQNNSMKNLKIWSIEPQLNRALLFAKGEGLINLNNAKYTLTEKGIKFFKKIEVDTDLFTLEKEFLYSVGQSLSETLIEEISKTWEESYV